MMTRSSFLLGAFILSLPITVRMGREPSPADTASRVLAGTMRPGETRLTLGAGTSSFGIFDEGCQGEFIRSREFRQHDVGGDLEHSLAGPMHVGVRAGSIHEEQTLTEAGGGPGVVGAANVVTHSTRDNSYVNPYARFTDRSFEFSLGAISSRKPFSNGDRQPERIDVSAGMRVGRLDRAAFRVGWMEGVPVLGDGDQLSIGAEAWPSTKLGLFVGGAFGPDHSAMLLRGNWWVTPVAAVNFSGRIGPVRGDITTGGASLGFTLRTPPHDAASPPAGSLEAPVAPPATPPDSSRRSP